jgi:hypothetical protein
MSQYATGIEKSGRIARIRVTVADEKEEDGMGG